MAELRRSVTYEVHALRGSRWEIHARFDDHGRQAALTHARSMTRHPRILAVRVVKEIYDPEAGGAQEFIIYKSQGSASPVATADSAAQATSRRRRLPRRLGRILAAPLPIGALAIGLLKAVATSPQWTVLPRAIFGTMTAFAAAVLVTGVAAYMLNGGPNATAAGGANIPTLLAVFAIIFMLGAVLVGFMLTTTSTTTARRGLVTPARKRPAPPAPSRPAAPAPPVARPAPPPRPSTPEPSAQLSRKAEEMQKRLVDYLRQTVQPARGAYDLKDSYIRFGINLFVAGACEALCQRHEIETSDAAIIMAAGLRAVGVDADHAATLAENYVEYLISDSRYMAMFGRGREAITEHLAGKARAADLLLRALDDWTRPHNPENARNIVTIMFTRMIGFEEFAAAQGDQAIRDAVHAHNHLVDRRLADYGGKRIKHIHDGTMAAFMVAAQAVRAADAIRADFAELSRHAPDRRLSLAVGLNCGEPIAEGNDLFGASVQLAARVASSAKAGQILVSEAVRDRVLAEAPTITFKAGGSFVLKGFGEPVPLYELTKV